MPFTKEKMCLPIGWRSVYHHLIFLAWNITMLVSPKSPQVWGFPRTIHSGQQLSLWLWFIITAKSAKGQGTGVKSGFQSLLPVVSFRALVICQCWVVTTRVKCWKVLETSAQDFCWGLLTWVLSAKHKFKSQMPGGKQVFHWAVWFVQTVEAPRGTLGNLPRSGSQMPPPWLARLRERHACCGGASLCGALGGLLSLWWLQTGSVQAPGSGADVGGPVPLSSAAWPKDSPGSRWSLVLLTAENRGTCLRLELENFFLHLLFIFLSAFHLLKG